MATHITIGLVLVASTAAAGPSPAAHSAPRADWPCRLDVVGTDRVTWQLEYAGPTSCVVPIEAASDGIVGCPTKIAIANQAATYSSKQTLTYDSGGHLVSHLTPLTEHTYSWNGDTLLKAGDEPYRVGAHVVKVLDDKPMLDIAVDPQNHPIAIDSFDHGTVTGHTTLAWRNTRLLTIEMRSTLDHSVTKITAVYDCAK